LSGVADAQTKVTVTIVDDKGAAVLADVIVRWNNGFGGYVKNPPLERKGTTLDIPSGVTESVCQVEWYPDTGGRFVVEGLSTRRDQSIYLRDLNFDPQRIRTDHMIRYIGSLKSFKLQLTKEKDAKTKIVLTRILKNAKPKLPAIRKELEAREGTGGGKEKGKGKTPKWKKDIADLLRD
jgi:hypothetical protein